MKKTIILLLIITLLSLTSCKQNKQMNNDNQPTKKLQWEEISETGVDEALLLKNINDTDLETIANLLQTLTDEILEKERQDPAFAFSAGWVNYTLESSQFKTVLAMGDAAAKPLHLIIHKSQDQYLYEYICAMALAKITHFEQDWTTSKEFLEALTKQIINEK